MGVGENITNGMQLEIDKAKKRHMTIAIFTDDWWRLKHATNNLYRKLYRQPDKLPLSK